jgi:putative peptide zinc metalloprotease protein
MPAAATLPRLRDELVLLPGPASAEGWPTWTLLDPVRNRFFRLSWAAFEILSRWDAGDADTVAARVEAETTLEVAAADVEDLVRFLHSSHLLRPLGPGATAELERSFRAAQPPWWRWLLHNYLFVRIPLVRPDRLLGRLLPWLGWAWSPGFRLATAAALAAGLVLVGRQWELFRATLVSTATLGGLAGYAASLAFAKVIHELGHALTARRLGCRVPTMGIALLVMLPVLYTDTTEAWKLVSRRQRLAVAAAGIAAEAALAAWALLAWSLAADGTLKGMVFMLATTTLVSTLVINTSPFMRFDGYFLLMDFLDMPNLHARSSAMGRWQLREWLFGLGEPVPEALGEGRRRALVAFAFATWIYRLAVFLGIAVLVYHFFIKVVGILLFAVEVGWFVALPIVGELREWWRRRRGVAGTRRGRRSLLLAGLAAVAALVPWQARVNAPALLEARDHRVLYTPVAGRLVDLHLVQGGAVAAGAVLAVLDAPDLRYKLAQARAKAAVLGWELSTTGADPSAREHAQELQQQLEAATAQCAGLDHQLARLDIRAPAAGTVIDVPPDLAIGQWLPAKERLGALRAGDGAIVEAYVDEEDVGRLQEGASARFIPGEAGRSAVPARVTAVERLGTAALDLPQLASIDGGGVPARLVGSVVVPDRAVYRVRLDVVVPGFPAPDAQLRGRVVIDGDRRSLLGRALRTVAAVFLREAGM